MTKKEIAIALYGVLSAEKGRSSKKLAELAELEYSPVIKEILRTLLKAGKVQFVEGRWVKVNSG